MILELARQRIDVYGNHIELLGEGYKNGRFMIAIPMVEERSEQRICFRVWTAKEASGAACTAGFYPTDLISPVGQLW